MSEKNGNNGKLSLMQRNEIKPVSTTGNDLFNLSKPLILSKDNSRNSLLNKSLSMTEDSISGIDFPAHISPNEFNLSLSKFKSTNLQNSANIVTEVVENHEVLKKYFDGWLSIVKKSQENQINYLNVLQRHNKRLLRNTFDTLVERSKLFAKLREIGQNIKIQRHFNLWRSFHTHESQLRQQYLLFLLKRRQIYEKSFFIQWKNRISLNRKVQKHENQYYLTLQAQAFQAFKENVKLSQNEKKNIKNIKEINRFYCQRVAWKIWRTRIRQKRLERALINKDKKILVEKYFDRWTDALQRRNRQRSKLINIKIFVRNSLIRRYLHLWINRYNERMEVEDCALAYSNKFGMKIIEKYFYLWISNFNSSNYYSQCAHSIVLSINNIKTRYYFGIWLSKFHQLHHRNNNLKICEEKYVIRQENKYFARWKSKFYFTRFTRLKSIRFEKKMEKIILNSYFARWRMNFRIKNEDEFNEKQSCEFYKLSLMMKAFSRMKVFAEEKINLKRKIKIAEKFRKNQLLWKAYLCWRNQHKYIARQCFLVTSVLKVWSLQAKKKRFLMWRNFVLDKKKKRKQMKEAYDIYISRCYQFVINGFVVGSTKKVHPPKLNEIKFESSSEDLLKSDDENEKPIQMKIKSDFVPIEPPKRPDFLPLK